MLFQKNEPVEKGDPVPASLATSSLAVRLDYLTGSFIVMSVDK